MLRKGIIPTIALALASGFFVTISFPRYNLGFLSWVALIPVLCATLNQSPKKAFGIGWLAGFTAYFGMLYWIIPTFQAARVSTWLGVLSLGLLSSYLALYFGLFTMMMSRASARLPGVYWALFGAALWTALEWFRGFFLSGFPWGLLGYSQWNFLPAIQISEWLGVAGVSASIVLVNLVLAELIVFKRWSAPAAAALALFIAANAFLFIREKKSSGPAESIQVAVLQGNIDQYRKWDKEYEQDILNAYGSLSEAAAGRDPKPDLIVWPETAAPGWLPNEEWLARWVRETVRRSGTHHLIGAVTRDKGKNFNSAFLFAPDGEGLGRYDKIRLVPFGEFVPAQPLLGRWIGVLNELGGFDGGNPGALLETPKAKLGPDICYEAIFPELIRQQVKQGARLIVNITNDGWYLKTAAPEQHFAMNALRAVENRRYVVRAANTGISGIFNPLGKVSARTALMERTEMSASVPLRSDITFYSRFGNVFAWISAAAALLGAAFLLRRAGDDHRTTKEN